MCAEEIGLLSVPFSGATSMNTGSPVPVFLPVALSAEAIGLLEGHRLAAGQVKLVPVLGVMTVQTPPMLLVVAQHDLRVEPRQLPTLRIGGHHFVACGAGVDPGREGGWRDFQLLRSGFCHVDLNREVYLFPSFFVWATCPDGRKKEKKQKQEMGELQMDG